MPNGEDRWFSIAFSQPEKLGETPVNVLCRLTDVDREKTERDCLLKQARNDSMTGLLNKGAMEIAIRDNLRKAGEGDRFALFMLDIDHFKYINDSFGHFAGDEALRRVAGALRKLFRKGDVVGRTGGDEFMIFIPYSGHRQYLTEKAEQILDELRSRIAIEGSDERLTTSIGIACYPEDGSAFSDLYRRADSALYRAKELGRDRWCLA